MYFQAASVVHFLITNNVDPWSFMSNLGFRLSKQNGVIFLKINNLPDCEGLDDRIIIYRSKTLLLGCMLAIISQHQQY